MSEPNTGGRLARRAIIVAIVLGVLGDALLRQGPGLGFGIWVVAVAAAAGALIRVRDGTVRREVAGWLAVAAALGLALTWRDSEGLRLLTVLGAVVAFGLSRLAAVREPATGVFSSTPGDILVAGLRMIADLVTGLPRLAFRDAGPWQRSHSSGTSAARIVGAAAVAVVVLAVFGALLVGADPVFAAWADIFRWDLQELFGHLALAGVVAWLVAGGLRGGLFRWELGSQTAAPVGRFALGTIEVTTILGSLAVLFAIYVAAQIAWIAGGAEFVRQTTDLTFAEFARRGFFQLVFVAGLLLPLLLAVRAAVPVTDTRTSMWYTRLAYVLVALLAVILVSAGAKLRLYVQFYRFSADRLYAAVVIAWLMIVFVWLVLTILRDKPRRFAGGALASAFAVLLLLHLVGPDATVARYNVSHPLPATTQQEPVDFYYLASLSGDAVPTVVPAILRAPARTSAANGDPSTRGPCDAARVLLQKWNTTPADRDWRSWSAGEARARRVVAQYRGDLERIQCPVRGPVAPLSSSPAIPR